MLVMALIALFGLVGVVLVSVVAHARGATHRATIEADVEREASTIAHRAQEIDAAFVEHALAGGAVDQAVADYQRERAVVLTGDQPDCPWKWGNDTIQAWQLRERRRRSDEANRRLFVPVIGAALVVVLVTVTAIVVTYQHLDARPSMGNGLPPALGPSPTPLNGTPIDPTAVPEGQP